MSINKITSADLANKGVLALDDVPSLTANEMKEKFEEVVRSVVVPKVNELVSEVNNLSKSFEDEGIVTPEQIQNWNNKADKDEASYRALTKTAEVGGSQGWYKVLSVSLAQTADYNALIAVSSAHSGMTGAGVLALKLRNSSGNLTGNARWIAADGISPSKHIVAWQNNTAELYVNIELSGVTFRYSIIHEGNARSYSALAQMKDNFAVSTETPEAVIASAYASGSELISFSDGAALVLRNSYAEYAAAGNISSLTITYPSGNFEAWIAFTTAAEGTITITLPSSRYIGDAPQFGNGETWEMSIKNGVVIAAKCS